jgi:hypothetical protein
MAKDPPETTGDATLPASPETCVASSGETKQVQGESRDAPAQADHPTVRYEHRDVRFPAVALVIVFAIICGAADFYAVWTIFQDRERDLHEQNVSRYLLDAESDRVLPVAPRLEQLDRLEGSRGDASNRQELSQEQLLATYDSTPEEGYIRIPIERAMDLVSGKLRSRSQGRPTGKDSGLVDAGESNSGRMLREPPP